MDSERRCNSLHGDAMQEKTRKSNGRVNFISGEKKPSSQWDLYRYIPRIQSWGLVSLKLNAERG